MGPSEETGLEVMRMIQVSDDRDMDQGKAVMVVGNGQIMIYFEGRAFKTCLWLWYKLWKRRKNQNHTKILSEKLEGWVAINQGSKQFEVRGYSRAEIWILNMWFLSDIRMEMSSMQLDMLEGIQGEAGARNINRWVISM